MATMKSLDRFIEQLDVISMLGQEVLELEDTLKKHEAKALARVLLHLKPIMPFVDGPIPTRESWVGEEGDREPERSYYSEPGIVLVDNFESQIGEEKDGGHMNYAGFKVIFTRSGKLIHLLRYGSWSAAHHRSFWSSEAFPTTITADFAHKHLKEALGNVLTVLQKAVRESEVKREDLKQRLKLVHKVNGVLKKGGTPAPNSSEGQDLMGAEPYELEEPKDLLARDGAEGPTTDE